MVDLDRLDDTVAELLRAAAEVALPWIPSVSARAFSIVAPSPGTFVGGAYANVQVSGARLCRRL